MCVECRAGRTGSEESSHLAAIWASELHKLLHKIMLAIVVAGALEGSLQIYDGVFNAAACADLHKAACSRGLGHALYTRASGPSTPLESAFEHFLSEMGDDSAHVEYWSRQEWKHIEAHADVDEKLAANGGGFRYPRHGHVLYLSVGSRVQGPTCVWEMDGDDRFGGALTTVPAIEGRVLRFDGELQHAVPRPADVWLAPFVINQSGPPDEFERSVVLFNSWPDEPPLDVQREESPASASGSSEGPSPDITAIPRAQWRTAEPQPPPSLSGKTASMKLWLLGDEERRGRAERTRPILVDPEATLAALTEAQACTRIEPLKDS